ncbi:hypothetical protein [Blastopirellula marina]|uniref:Uncharacterized protein n=1 Tax=Blastopirellula marina TaxID=124 RepID=A0A2S8FX04_9BACT|nr:hypothetical protein [Blastopirellula marina]PQO36707.1 hypothetical protein C5Y98_12000 [Blastopirellula marina]PTL44537.1 hypothetical protein C5Y97_12010 [Blastopirellula marina]
MQLDKTRIAIRERELLEIYDLALIVMRVYWWKIIQALAITAIPLTIINAAMLWAMRPDLVINETAGMFLVYMVMAIFLQAPLAGLPITVLLGDALFHEKPNWRRMCAGLWAVVPRIIWVVFILRGILPGMLLLWWASYDEYYTSFSVLILLCIYAAFMRTWRPYIGEILVLEKNPIFAKQKGTITVGLRSSSLHNPNFGDLLIRGMASAICIPLACSIVLNIFGIRVFVFGLWNWDDSFMFFWFPLGLWLVVAFMTVVRFLCYLDLRIRREGWEVELVLRAEASRMKEIAG